jgi:hypothetical protein
MTPHLTVALFGVVFASASSLSAQNSWDRLVASSDSFGPEVPTEAPSPNVRCGAGVHAADSIQVSGGTGEYSLAARSQRTRGYFTSIHTVPVGASVFALREVLCEDGTGRPIEFVIERDHRYFHLRFLHARPSYRSLRFPTGAGDWAAPTWIPHSRTFTVEASQPGDKPAAQAPGRP